MPERKKVFPGKHVAFVDWGRVAPKPHCKAVRWDGRNIQTQHLTVARIAILEDSIFASEKWEEGQSMLAPRGAQGCEYEAHRQ